MSDSPSEGVAATGLPYSVKLEQTAKEIRASVHVYNADSKEAVKIAIEMLESIVMTCESKGINIQPIKVDVKEPMEVATKK